MKARLTLAVAIAVFALSCSKHSTQPILPPVVPPVGADQVEAVFPPARSTGVLYDSAIWVQFTVPVDTTTINDRTVFFKTDTQRLPATRTWDPATRRLWIGPADRLTLRKTYTVELAASIRFTDGDRKSTRLNSSHIQKSRMPSSA